MRQCCTDVPHRSRITGRVAAYVWGPDVGSSYTAGRSMQSAGGVGGLLMVLDGVSTSEYNQSSGDPTDDDYFPLMDRMGNVTGYKKASTTTPATQLDAIYDYDAFGQEVRSSGPAADVVPYHFSTKFTDATGLVYYGYRWYDAAKGRWLSKDPIGEKGGVNLFGMVGNGPVSSIDKLGLDSITLKTAAGLLSADFGVVKYQIDKDDCSIGGSVSISNLGWEKEPYSGSVGDLLEIFSVGKLLPKTKFGLVVTEAQQPTSELISTTLEGCGALQCQKRVVKKYKIKGDFTAEWLPVKILGVKIFGGFKDTISGSAEVIVKGNCCYRDGITYQ